MISYGMNERISGIWLVQEVLAKKLIYFPEHGMVTENGKTRIADIQFSEEVKQHTDLKLAFKEVVMDFLHLFQFVEENERLRTLKGGGMHALLYFTNGKLEISQPSEKNVVLNVDRTLFESTPGGLGYFKELVKTILAFSGDDAGKHIVILPENGYHTEFFGGSLSVTYQVKENLEQVIPKASVEENAPEVLVNPEVQKTLDTLSDMFKNMDEQAEAFDSDRYKLTYSGQNIVQMDRYTVEVPDGFSYNVVDESTFQMYLVNPENPTFFEASLFTVQTFLKPFSEAFKRIESGRNLHFLMNKSVGEVTVPVRIDLLNVMEKDRSAAENAAKVIADHIRA